MYTIVLAPRNGDDPITIDNDDYGERSRKTISPQLELEENAFGSLSFTLPSFNIAYEMFDVDELSMAEVRVYHANESDPVFRGRLLEVKRDSQKNRAVIFEGELAYLADTIQEPAEYKEVTPEFLVGKLLTVHNRKSPHQFLLGNVTVTDNDSADHITGRVNRGSYSIGYNDTTWSVLQSLVSELGGYFKVRWVDGVRYLDYLKEHDDICSQTIELGKNLLDYAEEWSLAELYTVVVPLGANVKTGKTDEKGNEISEELTVASVNNGSPYLTDRTDIIQRYGRREKAIKFSGIADPYHLYRIGILYLNNIQFDNMVLNLTAADLYELGFTQEATERIRFQSKVHATAAPYGLDKEFPVTKVSIPLKDPSKAVYTMTTNTRGIRSISDKVTDISDEIADAIDDVEEEISDQIEKKTATPAATPDDWMFGMPVVVYPTDEFSGNLLLHMSFATRGWDVGRGWSDEKREFSLADIGGTGKQPLLFQLPDLLSDDPVASDMMAFTHAPIVNAAVWEEVEKESNALYMTFIQSTCGTIPVSTYKNGTQESGCRVLYLVVQFEDSSEDDSDCGVIGFETGNSVFYFGSKGGKLYYIDSSGNLENKSNWVLYKPTPIVGLGALPREINTTKPVVFMISHGIKEDDDYPYHYNLLIGSETTMANNLISGVHMPAGTTPDVILSINATKFKINYNTPFTSSHSDYVDPGGAGNPPIPDANSPKHTVRFYRAVECYGVYGQITMKEAVENVAWLVGRFVTGTIASDNDGLPEEGGEE